MALASGWSARDLKKIMEDIISKTFTPPPKDTTIETAYDARNLEEALMHHLSHEVTNTKLSELKHLKSNTHNNKLRVIVTTIQYDRPTGHFTPMILDSDAEIGK